MNMAWNVFWWGWIEKYQQFRTWAQLNHPHWWRANSTPEKLFQNHPLGGDYMIWVIFHFLIWFAQMWLYVLFTIICYRPPFVIPLKQMDYMPALKEFSFYTD
jgi:hypothetical protein